MFQRYPHKRVNGRSSALNRLIPLCMAFFIFDLAAFASSDAPRGGLPPEDGPAARQAQAEIRVAATIGGNGFITERDLADFTASESCYGPDALNSRKAGFIRMLEAGIWEEILRGEAKNAISPADYAAEIERIDRETQAPEILMCVKKHFGFDQGTGKFGDAEGGDGYKRVFIRKYIAQKRGFNFIHYDAKVQKEAYRLRDLVIREAGAAPSAGAPAEDLFPALAGKYGLVYSTHVYALEGKDDAAALIGAGTAASPPPVIPWSPFEKRFIEEHLAALKPGEMKKEPVESAYDIQFVRLLGAAAGKYYFQSLRIKKKDDYFPTSPKLRCGIKDGDLKKWILGISGNPMFGILKFE